MTFFKRHLFPLLALGLFTTQASALKPAERQIILISIDGFPAWMWHDESLPVPNLRKLAAAGATAEAMMVSNPSITWINHTTLVTGVSPQKHGVLFNGLLVRQGPEMPPKIEQWADKTELVFTPTLYDLAHEAGLKTAEVDWVAITKAKTVDFSFPELPNPEGKLEKEVIAAGLLTAEQCKWFGGPGGSAKNPTWRDTMWTKVAAHVVKTHQPNLLMYHILNTDAVHHSAGPASWGSYSALAYADRLIGDLVQAVDESGMRDRTTFFITTDHGFKKVKTLVFPNVALKNAGHATALGNKIIKCEAAAMTQGGMAFVYVTDPAKRDILLPKLKELFTQTEGIDRVIDGNDGPSLGMPTPKENQGMGDLILYAKDGYAFNNNAAGESVTGDAKGYGGTHGYLNTDPELDGIFIASGADIKPGMTIPRIVNLDVAPTIAKLLDLTLPKVEGRVLEEIIK